MIGPIVAIVTLLTAGHLYAKHRKEKKERAGPYTFTLPSGEVFITEVRRRKDSSQRFDIINVDENGFMGPLIEYSKQTGFHYAWGPVAPDEEFMPALEETVNRAKAEGFL